eukprot:m.225635 g.225635  ORF g.225635 m.225635 type:complete len:183 (-) comp22353_c1_seq19:25-573(-)
MFACKVLNSRGDPDDPTGKDAAAKRKKSKEKRKEPVGDPTAAQAAALASQRSAGVDLEYESDDSSAQQDDSADRARGAPQSRAKSEVYMTSEFKGMMTDMATGMDRRAEASTQSQERIAKESATMQREGLTQIAAAMGADAGEGSERINRLEEKVDSNQAKIESSLLAQDRKLDLLLARLLP